MRIIAGRWKGHRIDAPGGRDVRPTADRVREAWMSALGGRVVDARVLDLFAGSGALGLEALSRGAAHAVFVERDRRALAILRENVAELGAEERARIVSGDVHAFLAELEDAGTRYDIALADPPYAREDAVNLLRRWRARPFAELLCLEHAPGAAERLDGIRAPAWSRDYGDSRLSFYDARPAVGPDDGREATESRERTQR